MDLGLGPRQHAICEVQEREAWNNGDDKTGDDTEISEAIEPRRWNSAQVLTDQSQTKPTDQHQSAEPDLLPRRFAKRYPGSG